MSDLPKDYDVIIVGTGLVESIVAAALSRIGKTVLHIDKNQYYGGEFSSHSLTGLAEWVATLDEKKPDEVPDQASTQDDPSLDAFTCNNDLSRYFFDIEQTFDEKTKEELLKKSRNFLLDLSPNVFYSSGRFINLLISSDVARYCEFKMVWQILTQRQNGQLEKVPTSRSEVFKSNQLGIVEKRVMMQFVQSCLKDNDFADFGLDQQTAQSMSFRQLIESKKLPETITHYLINAVAMSADESRSALDGLRQTRKFLKSVGRFGDSPFLYCLYGSGELTQCFCRMAAVFGALYYLTLNIDKFYVNKSTNLIESIDTRSDNDSFKFTCKHLILNISHAPISYMSRFDTSQRISRCILITNKSIYLTTPQAKDEHVSLLYLPKTPRSSEIHLLECSNTVNCCPKDYFFSPNIDLVYMFCLKKNATPKEDFQEAIETMFERRVDKPSENKPAESNENVVQKETDSTEKPTILFEFYFSHLNSSEVLKNNLPTSVPDNLHIVSASSVEIDFDSQIEEAEKIFRKICPSEEFLPRPPDPEDIIIETSPMANLDESGAKESEKTESESEPEAKEAKLTEPADDTAK